MVITQLKILDTHFFVKLLKSKLIKLGMLSYDQVTNYYTKITKRMRGWPMRYKILSTSDCPRSINKCNDGAQMVISSH